MPRTIAPLAAVAAGLAVLLSLFDSGTLAFGDHGTELYTPDRLEWAALHLQAVAGQNAITSPLLATFAPDSEQSTIRCVLYYAADYDPAAVSANKEWIQRAFDAYKASPGGWGWLKLKFVEVPTRDRWPQG